MGILLTLPTSSAAICIAIGLDGLAGGAVTVGCVAHMMEFAIISYRDNGLSTSMLQIPNVLRKPILFLPVVASAIGGGLATTVWQLPCISSGAGMGTSGLVGVFGIIDAVEKMPNNNLSAFQMWSGIIVLMFIIPLVVSWIVAYFMRKKSLIIDGDLKIIRTTS